MVEITQSGIRVCAWGIIGFIVAVATMWLLPDSKTEGVAMLASMCGAFYGRYVR